MRLSADTLCVDPSLFPSPRNMNVPTVQSISTPLLLLLAVGCSSAGYEGGSGFLEDYSQLTRDPDSGAFVWRRGEMALKGYDRIQIEPIEVLVDPTSSDDVTAEELDLLSGQFLAEFLRACDGAYPFVPDPGPGVVRMRVAITNVLPVQRDLVDAEKEARLLASGRLGGASIEAEFRDSVTGDLLGAFVDTRSSKGYTGIIDGELSRYGKALGAFRGWAEQLRTALDDAHAGS